jgi:DNA polymerase elongation subunit (family B)
MKFYKNFFLKGSTLFVREHDNGQDFEREFDVKPKLYLESSDGKHSDIFGNTLKEISFDSPQDARKFAGSVTNKIVCGFDRFAYTEINSMYGNEYDATKIKIIAIDIENNIDDIKGFPDVENANCPINAITLSFRGTLFTFTTIDTTNDEPDVRFTKCRTEKEMLLRFMQIYCMIKADIITGWNSNGYDIPFLIKRIEIVCGKDVMKKLSPFGIVKTKKVIDETGRSSFENEIAGVSLLDYLEIYKKFRLITRESYKLDFIAKIELNDSKVEYDCSFREFYGRYPMEFIRYNAHDVRLIDKLEKKLSMIQLVIDIAYVAKCNYIDVMKNSRVWDIIIANYLADKGVQVPFKKSGDGSGETYEGAFVQDPIRGYYDWIISEDATALYPSMIIQYNISPETMMPKETWATIRPMDIVNKTDLYYQAKSVADKYNATLCGNGVMFKTDQVGFVPTLAEMMFDKRKEAKDIMLDWQKKLEKINKELETRVQ